MIYIERTHPIIDCDELQAEAQLKLTRTTLPRSTPIIIARELTNGSGNCIGGML